MSLLRGYQSFRNMVDYHISQWLRLSRPGFTELADDKTAFFDEFPFFKPLEDTLLKQFPQLAVCRHRSDGVRYLQNLNRLSALSHLESLLPLSLQQWAQEHRKNEQNEAIKALEVGVKNWDTVDALWLWLNQFTAGAFTLDGVECDLWRLYWGGHSRWDAAHYFMQPYPQCRLLSKNALDHREAYDIVTIFLPFLFKDSVIQWGLPGSFHQPKVFFQHVTHTLLKPGGLLVITNQSETEFEAMQGILNDLSLANVSYDSVPQPFVTHQPHHTHIGSIWAKAPIHPKLVTATPLADLLPQPG